MEQDKFGELLASHCEWMTTRYYSADTITLRKRQMQYFALWCHERGIHSPMEVTRAILERYQRHLFHKRKEDGMPFSISTQQGRLISIKMFYRWLARLGHIQTNPAADLEIPARNFRLPTHILSVQEVETTLNLPDTKDPLGFRDRAMLETFYSTGLRRMEIAHLLIRDIDFSRGVLLVRQGKGNKDRYTPVGQRALSWVSKYLEDARPKLVSGVDDGQLFLTRTGKGFSPAVLGHLVRRYLRLGAPDKKGSAHLFRHTMATMMLDNGADLRYVQEMLGHAKLSTTQIYTHVAINKLKAIHTATHPAEKTIPEDPKEQAQGQAKANEGAEET